MRAKRRGVGLAEVVVALVLLTVGVLALVGSSARMARMIGRGRHATVAAMAAAGRIEWLRHLAASSAPPCGAPQWRNDSAVRPGLTERWQILDAGGFSRRLLVVVRHRTVAGTSTDTFATALLCRPA